MTENTENGSTNGSLPVFPLDRRKCPLSIPQEYESMRTENPVAKVTNRMTGKPAWALTRYADVRRVLGDPSMSSNARNPGYPHQFQVPEEMLPYIAFPFAAMDPPEHTVRRRMVIPEFTAKRIAELKPRTEAIVDARIDAMLAKGGPLDLVAELAVPVPSLQFCELLGADPEHIGYFRRYAETTTGRDSSMEAVAGAIAQMDEFLDELITEKTRNPGEDLLSRIAAQLPDEPTLEHDDLVAIARLLVIAGSDTTANIISLGTVVLLEHPEQLDEIRRDPSLLPGAVEELLRFLSILDSATVRVATKDIELASGETVREGEGVLALNGAANWDPEQYPQPHRFDIHRDVEGHMAFSYGGHMCPGANLARMQLEVVFRKLFTRIPELRLAAPADSLPYMFDAHAYGLHELPVTW
ncbi:cytochrome P450 [Streptomyces sp. NPDC015127]|uniref:cytochrome P450 n=1 Tax=Streptomyces sp. NPDC015127 TaxID=3364939 RepID=UPI0036FF634B